ncbi:DUF4352 domain-containing protein [Streptomyces sp. PR69]|uniref:DUF4352 domain-containing protein n=1 Tax=Streptomyces sp. PR69 TaxID=2984950 RepID=UPI002263DDD1|nr:DUF4352 domain-containing protein [Streptomyces sp. PR69]
MRPALASAALLPALLIGVTACQRIPSAPAQGTPSAATAAERAAVLADGDAKGQAGLWIGQAEDVGGRGAGERLRIAVHAVVDPALSARDLDEDAPAPKKTYAPRPGARWIGVEVSLVNVGGRPYDAPITKAWVVDAHGKRHPAVTTGELTTGLPLDADGLAAGDRAEGWLAFEVPEDARIVRFHCTVGTHTRGWQL